MATILDGKKLADKILGELKEEIARMGKPLRLGIFLVGDDPASHAYVLQKKKTGEHIGVEVDVRRYSKTISTRTLRNDIGQLCKRPSVQGVIVQLPLPGTINAQRVLNAIAPYKDVDVLSERAYGAFTLGSFPILPPTLAGIMGLLEEYRISLEGKEIAIVGTGRLVGRPLMDWLALRDVGFHTVTRTTVHAQDIIKKADVLITGTPLVGHITGDIIKKGAVILDGGYGRTPDGKIGGNVLFEEAKQKASFITPVPGGVGALTVAMLFANLVTLAKEKTQKKPL